MLSQVMHSVYTLRIQWHQSGPVDTNYMFLFTQSLKYMGWTIHRLNSFIGDMCYLMNIRLCAVGAAPGLFNCAGLAVRGLNPVSYLNRTRVSNLQAVAFRLSTEYETIHKQCLYTSMYRSSVNLAHVIDRSIFFGYSSSWHIYPVPCTNLKTSPPVRGVGCGAVYRIVVWSSQSLMSTASSNVGVSHKEEEEFKVHIGTC
jgi:hypothetical protein